MIKSLLDSLPILHGTMLSITIGFVTAFALYAYQTTNSARQKLEGIKRQVQNISKPNYEGGIDRSKYLNSEGELDWQRLKDGLLEASALFSHIDSEDRGPKRETIIIDDMQNGSTEYSRIDYFEKHGFQRDAVYIEKSQIEKAAKESLGILSLIMTSHPYLGRGLLHKPDSDEVTSCRSWLDDLSYYNGFLSWLWNGYHRSLSELMNQYRSLDIQRQKDMYEKSLQQMLKNKKEQGIDMPDKEIRKRAKKFHVIHDSDYDFYLRDFFSKVVHIEQQLIPQAKENLIILTIHENRFKLKTIAIWVLYFAVYIFIFGIIIPMLISAYSKPPLIKSIELLLFITTTAPYLFGLAYLIAVVSRLNQP